MESKLLIIMEGLVLSLFLVNVASSASNEALVSDWQPSIITGFKPLASPLSTNIEINQAAAAAATGSTSFAGTLCQTFASQFGGTIINYLKQNNNPQQVCTNFGICMPTGGAAAGSTGGVPATGGFGFSLMLCGPCQMAVSMMQTNLNNQQQGQSQSQNQNAPPGGSMVGSHLCQSVSNLFRSPASVMNGQPTQVYNPPTTMPVVQSVTGGNVNAVNP